VKIRAERPVTLSVFPSSLSPRINLSLLILYMSSVVFQRLVNMCHGVGIVIQYSSVDLHEECKAVGGRKAEIRGIKPRMEELRERLKRNMFPSCFLCPPYHLPPASTHTSQHFYSYSQLHRHSLLLHLFIRTSILLDITHML